MALSRTTTLEGIQGEERKTDWIPQGSSEHVTVHICDSYMTGASPGLSSVSGPVCLYSGICCSLLEVYFGSPTNIDLSVTSRWRYMLKGFSHENNPFPYALVEHMIIIKGQATF